MISETRCGRCDSLIQQETTTKGYGIRRSRRSNRHTEYACNDALATRLYRKVTDLLIGVSSYTYPDGFITKVGLCTVTNELSSLIKRTDIVSILNKNINPSDLSINCVVIDNLTKDHIFKMIEEELRKNNIITTYAYDMQIYSYNFFNNIMLIAKYLHNRTNSILNAYIQNDITDEIRDILRQAILINTTNDI